MICGSDQEMSSIRRMNSGNKLANLMTDISKFGNLSRKYSNHSVIGGGGISWRHILKVRATSQRFR